MKLGILTAVWKRPELTALVLNYYRQLKVKGIEFEFMAVVSSMDDWTMAKNLGWDAMIWGNNPLGKKFNIGLKQFEKTDVDAVVIIGSDNLINKEYFTQVKNAFKRGSDYVTLRDLYIYDALKKRLVYVSPAFPGAGRCVGREVLEEVDWRLWKNEANYLLDSTVQKRLAHIEHRPHNIRDIIDKGIVLLDIKTDVNMWTLEGDRLVSSHTELHFKDVDEIPPEPFIEKYFPEEAFVLLNWNDKFNG